MTIRQQMRSLGIDHGPNGVDDDVRQLFGQLKEKDAQQTYETWQTHSKWAAGWLYKNELFFKCYCAWCRK